MLFRYLLCTIPFLFLACKQEIKKSELKIADKNIPKQKKQRLIRSTKKPKNRKIFPSISMPNGRENTVIVYRMKELTNMNQ